MSTVLVTGGAGFIGSHTSVAAATIYDIIILDNFVNSKRSANVKNRWVVAICTYQGGYLR